MTEMKYPAVLRDQSAAAAHLVEYCRQLGSSEPAFTGSLFDVFRIDETDPDVLGPSDILAVSMLGVHVPGPAILRILGADADGITRLLAAIPRDVALVDAGEESLSRDGAAWHLWRLLDGYMDVGTTITSKLMARKRPRLIPVQDSVVMKALGYDRDSRGFWRQLQLLLRAEGDFSVQMDAIRRAAGVEPQFSDLRVFDIAVWMHHRRAATR